MPLPIPSQHTKWPKLKITSDGTPVGTKISYNGTDISTISRLSIYIDINNPVAHCVLEFVMPAIEMEIDKELVDIRTSSLKRCPSCGKLVRAETAHWVGTETPMLRYSCPDCKWEESIAVPLDFNMPPEEKKEEVDDDQGNT